jgi:hypothetical protein
MSQVEAKLTSLNVMKFYMTNVLIKYATIVAELNLLNIKSQDGSRSNFIFLFRSIKEWVITAENIKAGHWIDLTADFNAVLMKRKTLTRKKANYYNERDLSFLSLIVSIYTKFWQENQR